MEERISTLKIEAVRTKLFSELRNTLRSFQEEQVGGVGSRTGKVVSYTDGVAQIAGLTDASVDDAIEVETVEGMKIGFVLDLEEDWVNCLILDENETIQPGDLVNLVNASKSLGVSVEVGDHLLESADVNYPNAITPLGKDFWTGVKRERKDAIRVPIERASPTVVDRDDIRQQINTHDELINKEFPIGQGQRMLLIGNRHSGKTGMANKIIRHLASSDFLFVYVAIAKGSGEVREIQQDLADVRGKAVVVATRSSDPASLHYIAPYCGCAIAEYWRDQGKQVIIVFDDINQHATAYRQIALLLRRAPGREAYPGDIFFLHSRLLERSACISAEAGRIYSPTYEKLLGQYGNDFQFRGGGSLTALPIFETLEGDMTAYMPTNLISMTDGQLYIENRKVDSKVSVSRLRGALQPEGANAR